MDDDFGSPKKKAKGAKGKVKLLGAHAGGINVEWDVLSGTTGSKERQG